MSSYRECLSITMPSLMNTEWTCRSKSAMRLMKTLHVGEKGAECVQTP